MDDSQRVVPEDEAKITLGLLNAVEANSALTQRLVARDLGIALGLANAYLKRCVRKGLIKVQQIPTNRYAYYLTPHGFVEKSRLTAQYLSISFNFFRGARNQCAMLLAECDRRGWRRVVLAGISDLAEIALLCASESEAKIYAIADPGARQAEFAGLKVVASLDDAGPFDAVIITDLRNPQATYDRLATLPAERILTPPMLNVSRNPPVFAE